MIARVYSITCVYIYLTYYCPCQLGVCAAAVFISMQAQAPADRHHYTTGRCREAAQTSFSWHTLQRGLTHSFPLLCDTLWSFTPLHWQTASISPSFPSSSPSLKCSSKCLQYFCSRLAVSEVLVLHCVLPKLLNLVFALMNSVVFWDSVLSSNSN